MQDELMARIAQDLGLDGLPLEEQQTLIGQFGEVALKAATLSVVGRLTEDKRGEFGRLAEAGDPTALRAFLDREVPGHEGIAKAAVAEEIQRFKAFRTAGAGGDS